MTNPEVYETPKVWKWDKQEGGRFTNINRPIAGPTHEKELPIGKHPLQLYSLATPNGVKVTVMLEELLEAGHDAEYDAWLINIGEGDQFGSGFVDVNPNSKIPGMMDHSTKTPTRIFESAAMLLYLSEKFDGAFVPKDLAERAEVYSWVMWLMGSAPYLGGGFGHFYAYAPEKWKYPIDRYTMEAKRQLDVLDRRLGEAEWLGGDDYSIADMATCPWYGTLVQGNIYEAGEFLDVKSYKNVNRWMEAFEARPAVKRGRMVNASWGDPARQLRERHDASDFDTQTQDKLEPAEKAAE